MEPRSFFQRVGVPILLVMGIMVISVNAYDLARQIENHTLHLIAAHTSAVLMFLTIWLGALFGNTIAFFRGASFKERLLVCLATPVVWSAKVLYSFWGIYSPAEFAFLFLHHLILGPPVVALLCMGISEIWCRIIYRRRSADGSVKVFEFNNTAVLCAGLLLVVFMLWNGGHTYYYLYMDLYTRLFL